MDKSQIFIRTNKETWGIFGTVPEVKNIPVISCVGTSRDGKSTSLNLYANYLIKNYGSKGWYDWLFGSDKKMIKPFAPFLAMQTDDIVTNGIDYYIIPEKCLLIDCQGMQLQDAKYDHYLMLITYLISNVIILTVRERLDLQVLNNCLAVFSFLSEIPDEYRRKDKPILLIRIKDFQNIKQLREDPTHLNKLVEKWLKKSGDQYDQIKEAFKHTFEIHVIATQHPTLTEDGDVDIHDDKFLENNKSFLTYCQKIFELSKNKKAPSILSKSENVTKLIDKLQENKKIDWKKLDLYHQITENELRKYAEEFFDKLNIYKLPLVVNGSIESYNKCINRLIEIEATKRYIYNKKFKDVTEEIKDEVFKRRFEVCFKLYNDAKEKNMELAEQIIKPHFDKYNSKYNDNSFLNFFITGLIDFFTDKKSIFVKELEKIDETIYDKYKDIIEKEEKEINEIQNKINKQNEKHILYVNKLIEEYNISKKINDYMDDLIKTNIKQCIYNNTYDNVISSVKTKILLELNEIYKKNDKTYYMKSNKQIDEKQNSMKYNSIDDFESKYNIDKYKKIHKTKKNHYFTECGFINCKFNKIDFGINNDINFVSVECNSFKFVVTKEFYDVNKIHDKIINIFKSDKVPINIENYSELNVCKILINLCDKLDSDFDDASIIFTNIMEHTFGKAIMNICYELNTSYSNAK